MSAKKRAWNRVQNFLNQGSFNGFTKNDLFILRFVKKGWGQDIATLSNMAEAVHLRHQSGLIDLGDARELMHAILERATHASVSPYRTEIGTVTDLGVFGYYHVIVGLACAIGEGEFSDLNERISPRSTSCDLVQNQVCILLCYGRNGLTE